MSTERVISVEFVAIGIGKIIQTTACGLFALAFATALCAGEDPQYLHFNTEGTYMRDHLLQCLENGVIQPFPSEMLRARRDMKHTRLRYFAGAGVPKTTICQSVLNVEKCSTGLMRITESNRIGMEICSITLLCDSCSN